MAKSVAILGGGITGLAAAHRLAALGHAVSLFEAGNRLGGAIRTEITGGWLVESGPNSLLEGPESDTAIAEAGLGPERLEASPAGRKRFIVKDGKPVPLLLSPPALLGSPLLSAGAKLRLLAEFFSKPRARTADASLAEFLTQHVGKEIVERIAQPFVSGYCAGDPARLSARNAFPRLWESERSRGSLLRAQIAASKTRKDRQSGPPKMISFRRGLQALPEALAAALPRNAVSLGVAVDRLQKAGGRWNIGAGHDVRGGFDAVIAALPAPALALLSAGAPEARPLESLAGIEHPPLSSVFLGYRRGQISHPLDGFGMLVPALERRSILGVLFSSSVFPGRAPESHAALTVMVGGAMQADLARLPLPDLLTLVRTDLRDLLGVEGEPVFIRHAFWPNSIPQYNIGHELHRATADACESSHPGLFIGGQALDGISLSACLAAGRRLADRAAAA